MAGQKPADFLAFQWGGGRGWGDTWLHAIQRTALPGAEFSGTPFSGQDFSRADLSWSNFATADLSEANLSGANLTGADLAGCYVDGISAWDLKLEGAKKDRIITPPDEPEITVDSGAAREI